MTESPYRQGDHHEKSLTALLISASILTSANVIARDREISVEITNITNATYFTELLVAAHDRNTRLFELSTAASPHLQAMAEGGNINGLIDDLEAVGSEYIANPAAGLLAPGASTEAVFNLPGNNHRFLSIVAMLLPTNDGFVGLNGLPVPKKKGTYIYYLRGYDAGTEANDEIITGGDAPGVPGIPADPGGNTGTGGVATVGPDHNPTIHIHRV
ncbi:spondin domain-containing protein [Sedimenticola selenatireducens]|uniref:spondin domain-containing protein n=1 Tax=Sedimenticola selenatireducens TaxID=191960 RepID=UPI0004AE2619|nr:spondin domain-containing protein [Sedimenticola selenatireducens]